MRDGGLVCVCVCAHARTHARTRVRVSACVICQQSLCCCVALNSKESVFVFITIPLGKY